MRIGLVIYGDLETISGGYLYDRMLVRSLRAAGHRVEIVSLPWRSYPRHLGDNLSVPLFRRLRNLQADLLLQDELNHPSLAWMNQRLRRHATYPIISIVHHLRSSESHPRAWLPLYRHVERRYLRHVDGCIFNSLTTCAAVDALMGERSSGIIAYPAADHVEPPSFESVLAQRTTACGEDGPLRILFVGNVIARKGLHTLLAALSRLPRSSWRLEVVGSLLADPAYVRRIRRQIVEDDLQGSVNLLGSAPEAALRRSWKQNQLLAMPSYEGFGIVYLEAMSYGLPVIALRTGAAHEIVTHGQNGYLIEPGDSQGLAAHVETLDRNRDLLLNMGMSARRRYEAHPSWHESMRLIGDWLEERTRIHG